jgi:hypothetical protein
MTAPGSISRSKHYALGLVLSSEGEPALAVPDGQRPDQFYLWGKRGWSRLAGARSQVQLLERSVNLTVNR